MRIGRSIALVIGIGLLAGCLKKYPDPPPPVTKCGDAVCDVKVTVQFSPCQITVDPPALGVSPGTNTIRWTVYISGVGIFKFPGKGDTHLPIEFDDNAKNVISNLTVSGNTVSATYTPSGSSGNHYGYGVYLLDGLGTLCSVDPWVVD